MLEEVGCNPCLLGSEDTCKKPSTEKTCAENGMASIHPLGVFEGLEVGVCVCEIEGATLA